MAQVITRTGESDPEEPQAQALLHKAPGRSPSPGTSDTFRLQTHSQLPKVLEVKGRAFQKERQRIQENEEDPGDPGMNLSPVTYELCDHGGKVTQHF